MMEERYCIEMLLMRVDWAWGRGIFRVVVRVLSEDLCVVLRVSAVITMRGCTFQP
jgi:hypothetical protein